MSVVFRRFHAVAASVVVLASAACGPSSQPARLAHPAVTVAPTDTAGAAQHSARPTPPAKTPSPRPVSDIERAEQTVRDYWAALNANLQGKAGDDALRKLVLASCSQCSADRTTLSRFRNAGKHSDGPEYEPIEVKYDDRIGRSILVNASVRVKAVRILDREGKVLKRDPAGPVLKFAYAVTVTKDESLISNFLVFGRPD